MPCSSADGATCMVMRRITICCAVVQYITVRNDRGREMMDAVRPRLHTFPTVSTGDRKAFVMATVNSDDE